MTRNGTDRVSDPFNGLHRLYNRAKLIFELAQCFMQRSFVRGQLPEARFPLVKSIEVFGNVRGSVPITMQDDSTFGVLATAKPSDLVISCFLFFMVGGGFGLQFLATTRLQRLERAAASVTR